MGIDVLGGIYITSKLSPAESHGIPNNSIAASVCDTPAESLSLGLSLSLI